MLILFYFLIAWKEPFPPIPSYGIELSFGNAQTGLGEQTPAATEPDEVVEDVEPTEESEIVEETTTTEVSEEAIEELEVAEEPLTETESPDVVQEEIIEQDVPNEPTEVIEEAVAEQPPASQAIVEEVPAISQGETEGVGDEGKPEGEIEGKAIYPGKTGDTNAPGLNITGWVVDPVDAPVENSGATGQIVFDITIDNEGYPKDVKLKSSSVDLSVAKIYEDHVWNLTFSKTSQYKPENSSTGTITFILQSKK